MRKSLAAAVMGAATSMAGWTGSHAAEVKVADYGVTKDGHPVHAYTLINDKGASATILDFAGAVAAIRVPDRDGKLGNVVLSFDGIAGWETMGHANSLIGRFANRIKNGFALDGVHYPLHGNAAGVVLHGGAPAYSIRMLTAEPIKPSDGAAVTMDLDSPDGDQGFPGEVKIRVTYRFGNDNALRVDYAATTDKPTVINLTNHIYFNLSGNSTVSVFAHDLQVMADKVAVKDADSVPTGELMPVAGTPFDLTRPTVLGERVAVADDAFAALPASTPTPAGKVRSFDHSFQFEPGINRLDRVAARLHDSASGRIMELHTTEPTVQVFTIGAIRPGLLSDVGKPFIRGPAVALETQHMPDSPNHPEWPTTVLRPGQTFHSTTIYAFKTDKAG